MHQLLSAHKGGLLRLLRHMVSLGPGLRNAACSHVWLAMLLGAHKVEEAERQGLPDDEDEAGGGEAEVGAAQEEGAVGAPPAGVPFIPGRDASDSFYRWRARRQETGARAPGDPMSEDALLEALQLLQQLQPQVDGGSFSVRFAVFFRALKGFVKEAYNLRALRKNTRILVAREIERMGPAQLAGVDDLRLLLGAAPLAAGAGGGGAAAAGPTSALSVAARPLNSYVLRWRSRDAMSLMWKVLPVCGQPASVGATAQGWRGEGRPCPCAGRP